MYRRGEAGLKPVNVRKWKAKVSPATGTFGGSFELFDLSQKRKVNFSGANASSMPMVFRPKRRALARNSRLT